MGALLSVENLSVQTRQKVILHNISFKIDEGDIVLLSGENGVGKSTVLKSIISLESVGKKVEGKIVYHGFEDVFLLKEADLQRYRSRIVYIPQKDDFAEMGSIQVRDVINESSESHSGKALTASEVNDLIDEWLPRRNNNSRIFDAKSKPNKFSGGEQRLLSVFAGIISRMDADLFIIDEPLNNLDYTNAKYISNLINRVIHKNPQLGLLMVSHCRIFPFFTRELQLTTNGIVEVEKPNTCYSCFGTPDADGFYR